MAKMEPFVNDFLYEFKKWAPNFNIKDLDVQIELLSTNKICLYL